MITLTFTRTKTGTTVTRRVPFFQIRSLVASMESDGFDQAHCLDGYQRLKSALELDDLIR